VDGIFYRGYAAKAKLTVDWCSKYFKEEIRVVFLLGYYYGLISKTSGFILIGSVILTNFS
jgi:hypothetical protein